MSFDWRTGDIDWDERDGERSDPERRASDGAVDPVGKVQRPAARYRRILLSIAMLSLALGAAFVLYRYLDRRAAAAESGIEEQVLASREIIFHTARTRDVELLSGFLSGRDERWTAGQQALAGQGLFYGRDAFGLTWLPEPEIAPQIVVAPDLQTAELLLPQRYAFDIGNGLTETVTLQHAAVFRAGEDRWLLSPPDPAYWGESKTSEGRYILLTYPARDAEIAMRLARDLDALMSDLCVRLTKDVCPSSFRLNVKLSTDPADLSVGSLPIDRWQGGREVVLPTPTLFGSPLDEAGYRVLYRRFGVRLVNTATAELSGWRCCNHSLYYGTLLAALRHRLGLEPWPLTAEHYARLATNPAHLDNMQSFWRGGTIEPPSENVWEVYALIEFLLEKGSPRTILELQQALLREPNGSYWDWLQAATAGRYGSLADFQADLIRYFEGRAGRGSTAALPGETDK